MIERDQAAEDRKPAAVQAFAAIKARPVQAPGAETEAGETSGMFQTKESNPGKCLVARAAGAAIKAVKVEEEEGNFFTQTYMYR